MGGNSYLVGERGPEIFMPSMRDRLCRIIGSVGVVNNIYVT
jgi:phage-related minor tail protein